MAILFPGGSAATTTKPYTANLCDVSQLVAGAYSGEQVCPEGTTTAPTLTGSTVVVYLTLRNKANPQALGSANIALPTGPSPTTYADASMYFGSGVVTPSSTLVTLRGLNLAPDHSITVKLTLNTPPCTAGTYNWGAAGVLIAKQSNDFNGPPGNNFSRVNPSSLTATHSGDCHLAVVPDDPDVKDHQPKDTVKTQTITDDFYSSGGALQVGLYDSNGNLVDVDGTCPSAGCVTASPTGGDPTAALSGTTSQPLVNGIASFGNLSIDKSSDVLYRLAFASSDSGVTGTSSDPFAIVYAGRSCDPGVVCPLGSTLPGTGPTPTTSSDVSTTFDTEGGLSLTFFTSGLPAAVTDPTGGCAYFVPTDSAGVTLNVHGETGTTTIDYGIADKALKKRYGPNYGQPNVPICVGAMRVAAGGAKIPCDSDTGVGWTGKALDTTGRLNGQFKQAVCDPTTHLWWGIVPTYQDNPNPPGLPAIEIVISHWGGTTAPDGTNLRLFTITKPNPWDFTMRG